MATTNCKNCGAENKTNQKYCSFCGHQPTEENIGNQQVQEPPITSNTDKRKKMLGSIVGIIVFGLSYWAVQQIFFKPPSFDKVMMQAASELNKTCPIMVDQNTRLENAIALPNNTFQYNYTLVELTKAEVNLDTLKKYIEPAIQNNVKTSPSMKIYRDNKTTLIYYYKDKDGLFVYKFSITPDMYN